MEYTKPLRCWLLVLLVAVTAACRKTPVPEQGRPAEIVSDSSRLLVVADTITYQVVIRNANPEDSWTAQCLGRLDHRLLVDQLFEQVYAGKITAYDHETHEKLTPAQVKKIESGDGFIRDNIGMIQFTEAWYLHQGTAMTKEVLAMVLGYNYYTPDGMLLYKALFRVEMKSRDQGLGTREN
jgi:hypothetical protein